MPPPNDPLVSRKPLAVWLFLCFLVSALLIPKAAHLAPWIEAELVLGFWWFGWASTLAWLLFRGHEIDDDTERPDPWISHKKVAKSVSEFLLWDGCGCVPDILFVGILITLLIWIVALIVELLIPLVAVLLFLSIGGMLARAVNDTHGCQGRFFLSVLWGCLWATVYTGPIAAAIIWIGAYMIHR